ARPALPAPRAAFASPVAQAGCQDTAESRPYIRQTRVVPGQNRGPVFPSAGNACWKSSIALLKLQASWGKMSGSPCIPPLPVPTRPCRLPHTTHRAETAWRGQYTQNQDTCGSTSPAAFWPPDTGLSLASPWLDQTVLC